MFTRSVLANIKKSLLDFPVVFIMGPKSAGKTTLVRELLPTRYYVQYATLDDPAVRSAARADPAGFAAGLATPVVIDEAHRAPGLFPAIRALVDRERIPGSFILTGSMDVAADPLVTEHMAGRMDTVTLLPLAKAEMEASSANAVDRLFAREGWDVDWGSPSDSDLVRAVAVGGYPPATAKAAPRRRRAWLESLVTTLVERDARDAANLHDPDALDTLLRLLAARAGRLLSYAEISRAAGVPQTTLKRHMALLRDLFLIWELPAWSAPSGRRLAKAPRLMFTDTGLATALLGRDEKSLATDRNPFASLLENFVASEMAKQGSWSATKPVLRHMRAYAGPGVGLVMEDGQGRIVGVETKPTATPVSDDFKGLRLLADACPDRFLRGVVLHLGDAAVPFGRNLWALPVAGL